MSEKDFIGDAIAVFSNEESKLSAAERMAELRKGLVQMTFECMKTCQKNSKGGPEIDDLIAKQKTAMKLFKDIEKLYASELKLSKGKKAGNPISSEFLSAIKSMQSQVSDIVQDIKKVS